MQKYIPPHAAQAPQAGTLLLLSLQEGAVPHCAHREPGLEDPRDHQDHQVPTHLSSEKWGQLAEAEKEKYVEEYKKNKVEADKAKTEYEQKYGKIERKPKKKKKTKEAKKGKGKNDDESEPEDEDDEE